MNINRFFIMRHGESLANKRSIIASHEGNALNNFGLTNRGADQVMNTALQTRLNQDAIIVSSDYLRAKETAELFHDIIYASSEIRYDVRLRERGFGNLELQNSALYEDVWKQDELSANTQVNNVETINSILNRALPVVDELNQIFSNKDILLVGHGDVLQILLAFHQGLEARFHRTLAPLKNAELRSLPPLKTQLSA